jgi:hypothetical protein
MKIAAQITRAEEFDWGNEQWGLIALSYVGARDYALKVSRALRPGDTSVVVEAFHREAMEGSTDRRRRRFRH